MKKMILTIFFIAGAASLPAQGVRNDLSKPKYLPANRAASYLNFSVIADKGKATIDISSLKNVRDYTFYLLKGVISDNGNVSWTILNTYRNNSSGLRKTYVDKIPGNENIMYRLMIIDKDQHIEYTPIRYLKSKSNEILKFASNE